VRFYTVKKKKKKYSFTSGLPGHEHKAQGLRDVIIDGVSSYHISGNIGVLKIWRIDAK